MKDLKAIFKPVEIMKPHCPKCGTQLQNPASGPSYMYEDDNPEYTVVKKECECSIWGWEPSRLAADKDPLDRYVHWRFKEDAR